MSDVTKMARRLAAYGRNGDTTLVHMHPAELAALERVFGQTTTNPVTGQPEAFSWKKLLLGLGAIAAAPFTGGISAALGLPLSAGTAATIGTAATALGSGLAASSFLPNNKSDNNSITKPQEELKKRADAQKAEYRIPLFNYAPPIQQQPGFISSGIGPEQYVAPVRQATGFINGLGQQIPGYAQGGKVQEDVPEQDEAKAVWEAVANGDTSDAMVNRFIEIYGMAELQKLLSGAYHQPEGPGQDTGTGYPQEEGMARGGLLKGPGGGMDDTMIARTTDGKPIALSGGEFVWTADQVSDIGDGSNEAGGRKLEAVGRAIRQIKHGRPEQPKRLGMGANDIANMLMQRRG